MLREEDQKASGRLQSQQALKRGASKARWGRVLVPREVLLFEIWKAWLALTIIKVENKGVR